MLPVQWEFSGSPNGDEARHLAEASNLPLPIARLLLSRHVDTPERVRQFFEPRLGELADPFMLTGMDQAVERLVRAMRERERVMVYGDYDVDGITSTSLLYLVLNRLGAEVIYYLPNRLIEGYGLSPDGIDYAVDNGVGVILTVDCGITAVEEVEYARSKGIEVIVADHHQPGPQLPAAAAIINPKLLAPGTPIDDLCGVGVSFKLAQALYRALSQDESELEEHLDLVALGTAADIVPLTGENRIITKYGLRQIERSSKPGLKSLCFVASLMGRPITTGQIVFVLAPRINAVGRLGDAKQAVRLLTTRDESVATDIAHHLERENQKRKKLDEETLTQALRQVKQHFDPDRDRAIVLASPGWHQGVIGIVASRLVERFHVPTVMIAIDGDEGKGSARSIAAFDLYDAFRECSDLVLRFGGHKYAAGMSIATDKIPAFIERFKRVAIDRLTSDDMVPKLSIDSRLDPDALTEGFMDILEGFAPFGPQNTRPVFVTDNIQLAGNPFIVGNNHLKFRIRRNGQVFDCIGFNMGDRLGSLASHTGTIDLVYVPERTEWDNNKRLQLRVKDFRLS
ncbi:MAG TPA: single-stranded-DNA-specific exonuclease RecJ [bacterium]|nr:single-stranded-DNA-specific exonuclease RecJ [bacterium]